MKILITTLILGLILVISGCQSNTNNDITSTTIIESSFNLPDDLLDCQTNGDCALIKGNIEQNSCCSYSSVNKKYKGWYRDKISENVRGCERAECETSLFASSAVCYEMQCRISSILVIEQQESGDYCEKDSDCTVKDVHNCCGYFPGCVNKDYYPDVQAVRNECQKEGLASVCGFREIESCRCLDNKCNPSE